MSLPDYTSGDNNTDIVSGVAYNMNQHARKAKIMLWLGRFVPA